MTNIPYLGLEPYQRKDAIFFFGREKWQQKISDCLEINKLTVLYGESGVGKSSLLQAGIVNRWSLEAEENLKKYKVPKYIVVSFKDWEHKGNLLDYILGYIKENVAKAMQCSPSYLEEKAEIEIGKIKEEYREQKYALPSNLFVELKALTEIIGGDHYDGHLFIILDQFEAYFQRYTQEDTFTEDFAEVVNSASLKVNFLIAIRSDEFYKVEKQFKKHIPDAIRNIELPPLNKEEAKQAIEKPIERYNFIECLRTSRLTVLSGEKGMGKSFILKTGVIPYWRGNQEDKQNNICNTIFFPEQQNDWEDEPYTKSVNLVKTSLSSCLEYNVYFLEIAKLLHDQYFRLLDFYFHTLIQQRRNLLIILDQFENYLGKENSEFDEELQQLFTSDLPVSFLISIRAKSYKKFQKWFADFPARKYLEIKDDKLIMPDDTKKVSIESKDGVDFVETILEGIRQEKSEAVVTPYLQLLMSELWKFATQKKTDKEGKFILSLDLLEEISQQKSPEKNIKEINKRYVDTVLKSEELSNSLNDKAHRNYQIIPRICFYLCTPSGGKRSLSVEDIVKYSEEDSDIFELNLPKLDEKSAREKIKKFLKYLNEKRILQIVANRDDKPCYEVYFNGLVPAIQGWRTEHRKQIYQILCHRNLPAQSLAQLRRNQWDLAALLAFQAHKFYREYDHNKYDPKHYPINLPEVDEALREILKFSSWASCPLEIEENENNPLKDFRQVVFSSDGKLLAASNQNGDVEIWDLSLVQKNIFDNNGKNSNDHIVIKAHDSNFALPNKKEEPRFLDMGIVFIPNKKMLVSGARDGKIKLWNLENFPDFLQNPISEFEYSKPCQGITSVSTALNNKKVILLAAGTWEGSILLWDIEKPKEPIAILNVPLDVKNKKNNWIWSVTIDSKGKYLAAGGGQQEIYLWDIEDIAHPKRIELLKSSHKDEIFSIAFSLDGNFLASGSRDKELKLWDLTKTGKVPISLKEPKEGVRAITFINAENNTLKIASASEDQRIYLWNLENPKEEPEVLHGHTYGVCSVAFQPTDPQRFVSCSWDRTIRFWNFEPEPKIFEYPRKNQESKLDPDAIAVVFINDEQFVIGYADGTVLVKGIKNHEQSKKIELPDIKSNEVSAIAFFTNQESKIQKVAWSIGKEVWVYLMNSKDVITKSVEYCQITSLAFSPDGKILALGSNDDYENPKKVKIWTLNLCENELKPLDYTLPVTSIVFKQDSVKNQTYLAVASRNTNNHEKSYKEGEITLWNVTSSEKVYNKFLSKASGKDSPIILAFSGKEGNKLALGTDNSYVELYKVMSEELLSSLVKSLPEGQQNSLNLDSWITALVFSEDGQWLATGQCNGIIQIWDLKHPNPKPLVLRGHEERINAIAFSPNGEYLVSASSDNTVRLQTVKTEALAQQLQNKLYRNLTPEEEKRFL
jgi:WD40 repeat protein